jgi:hypothetical protein
MPKSLKRGHCLMRFIIQCVIGDKMDKIFIAIIFVVIFILWVGLNISFHLYQTHDGKWHLINMS